MSVLSSREIVGRGFQHKFGDPPTANRQFALTLDDPNTPTQQMIDFVNIKHGDRHPEYSYLRCTEGSLSENSPDPWHAELTYTYELPPLGGNPDFQPDPIARKPVWSFSTGGAQVPALVYYDEQENVLPLVNAAGDYFEGLTTEEAEVRASISQNRDQFPLSLAALATNSLNSEPYLGGAKYTWKCLGVSAQQQTELVDGAEVNYWSVGVELVYRQSGWPLLLPHVGWNYISSEGKAAVYVRGPYGEKIAASNPQPLAEDGSLKCADSSCIPDILSRRVNPAYDFNGLFGLPPFL